MTRSLSSRAASLAHRARAPARIALVIGTLALLSHPAFAELPKLTTPTEGIGGATVAQGDWLAAMGGYFKIGITILGLVLGGLGFLSVVAGGIGKWKQYSAGRIEIGDLKEYFIMGAVLAIFMIAMVTYAFETIK